jgi:hypothetical protein
MSISIVDIIVDIIVDVTFAQCTIAYGDTR